MHSSSIACFGELLLRLSAPNRQLLLQSLRLDVHVGGAEANVGVSLARFGHHVTMLGTVADNPLGKSAVAELRRHGVITDHVHQTEGRMGLYFLSPGAGSRPSRVTYDRNHSAFNLARADSYDWSSLLQGVQWLHLSGISPALGPEAARATLDAAQAAHAKGIKVSFDGNFRPSLWQQRTGKAPAILRELFACAHIVFADYRDIAVVLGGEFPQQNVQARVDAAATMAFAAFPQLQYLACTQRTVHSASHHALGAMLLARDGVRAVAPAIELTDIVDRIGSGDAFAAGVLHGLIEGFDADTTIRFGLAAGCMKHSIPGDFNLVDSTDVMALVAGGKSDIQR